MNRSGQIFRAAGGWGCQNFQTIGTKVARLSALRTGRLYPKSLVLAFVRG
jgi:hypothetical protein